MISLAPSELKSEVGFYFHIPFCPHICPYCDFTKTSRFTHKDVASFFSHLEKQLDYFLPKVTQFSCATAYFGGGTPGLFAARFYKPLLQKLLQHFSLEEVTLETNPLTNIEHRFTDYLAVGFDRITLGCQSLCPQTLKVLGRKHSKETVLKNILWAKKAGFKNIQVDLIYGLKKDIRTLKIEDEVDILVNAGATGISAYALTLEKRTLFSHSHLADDENAINEYIALLKICQKLGLTQVETSNFSSTPTKHNYIYWYGLPYIGIGTGSHGLLPNTPENEYGIRYKVGDKIESYSPGNDILKYTKEEDAELNFSIIFENKRLKNEYREEMIFTLLRTPTGIPIEWINTYFQPKTSFDKLLNNLKIKRAILEGKIILSEKYIFLSAEEKLKGDTWALDFIKELEL